MPERPAPSALPARSPNRRRQRSVRVTVAVALLCLATLVVTGALLIGTLWATSTASVVALLAGWASVRILLNEIVQTRTEAARDRAQQAQAYRVIFCARVAEHDRFVTSMNERVTARETDIQALHGIVGLAQARAVEAQARVRTESQRTVQLQSRLDELTRELEEERADADSLASWDGAVASTVVDLLAWEERASADAPTRKHA